MTSVKCPECGREVERDLAACSYCGHRTSPRLEDGFVDHYAVLGISPIATAEEVARAYRKAANKCHPDHGGSKLQMAGVNLAWTVLSDPDTRRGYDEMRTKRADARARAAQPKPADYVGKYRWRTTDRTITFDLRKDGTFRAKEKPDKLRIEEGVRPC